MSIDELKGLQTRFFAQLKWIMKQEKCQYLKELCKTVFKQGKHVTYFNGSSTPVFRIVKKDEETTLFFSEEEKIECVCDSAMLASLHEFLKDDKKIQKLMQSNLSLMETLEQDFKEGQYHTIADKPYLVYDIETLGDTQDLRQQQFVIAYCFDSIS
jgi:hypothetical protein